MARRRAMYDGCCKICSGKIRGQSKPFANDGEEVAMLLDDWVHAECMDGQLSEMETRTQEPDWRGWADQPNRMHAKRTSRTVEIGRIKQQDGRDYKGRFASKPEA